MEYEKIKQIMEEMSNSKLSEMEIEFKDGMKISMKKDSSFSNTVYIPESPKQDVVIPVQDEVKEGLIITSPMVGTFYSKPSPDDEPFVTLNNSVNKGDTVCIIEAMKLMNEIESDYSGKIVEIYVKDGQPVEYGTKLFRVE